MFDLLILAESLFQKGGSYKGDLYRKEEPCTINGYSSHPVCFKSMTLKEAIKSSLIILKQVLEEKLNATNIEVLFCFIDFYSDIIALIAKD